MTEHIRADMKAHLPNGEFTPDYLVAFFWKVLTKALAESSAFAAGNVLAEHPESCCLLSIRQALSVLSHQGSHSTAPLFSAHKCAAVSPVVGTPKPLWVPRPGPVLLARPSAHAHSPFLLLLLCLEPTPTRLSSISVKLLHLILGNFYVAKVKGQFLVRVDCPCVWNTVSIWLPDPALSGLSFDFIGCSFLTFPESSSSSSVLTLDSPEPSLQASLL